MDSGIRAAGGASLTICDTSIFSSITTPTVWTDLDLSGNVGAKATLVFLAVTCANTSFPFAFRKNGDAKEFFYNNSAKPLGVACVNMPGGAIYLVAAVFTDASGILEWKTINTGQQTDIILLGYLN